MVLFLARTRLLFTISFAIAVAISFAVAVAVAISFAVTVAVAIAFAIAGAAFTLIFVPFYFVRIL